MQHALHLYRKCHMWVVYALPQGLQAPRRMAYNVQMASHKAAGDGKVEATPVICQAWQHPMRMFGLALD